MSRLFCLALPLFFSLTACGEITAVHLVDQPTRAEFGEVRAALLTMGCSGSAAGGGCHSVLTGGLQISINEPDPNQLEAEFRQVKALVDIQEPADSILLQIALPIEPIGHQVCFHQLGQSCAYQKVYRWIGGQPFPDCQTEIDSCFR